MRVVHGDGSRAQFDPTDVIYVNAGATRPADIWLDRLNEGGRLILPLTTDQGFRGSEITPPVLRDIQRRGAVFLIARDGDGFRARRVSTVAIFPCVGGRDGDTAAALAAAFERGRAGEVTRRQGLVPGLLSHNIYYGK